MSLAPTFLPLSVASDDEKALISAGVDKLASYQLANDEAANFYEGTPVVEQFGISVPPSMRGLAVAAGWGGVVVDVLEERLDFQGWTSSGDDFGLSEVFAQNTLDVDSSMAHLDALIYGVSFVSVGTGLDGEPSPLITPHSPTAMTAFWDRRARRVGSAVSITSDGGQASDVTLYGPDETVWFTFRNGIWTVAERDRHNLGRVPVVMVPNRIRGSRVTGRSEISAPVRYYTKAAIRTLLGLEVNREFYNAPQRIGLNIPEDAFTNADGSTLSQWSAIMGRVWMIPPNEDDNGPAPDVKQFSPSSPAPYLDQVKGYALNVAAEAGIPAAYFGIHTDNPSSADAIRAGEARLVERARRRQVVFGRAWREIGRLALLVRDGIVPPTYDTDVRLAWSDPATPTPAATADEIVKLTGANVLSPDSSIVYDKIGLTPEQQASLAADKRRAQGRNALAALRQVTQRPEQAPNVTDTGA